MSLAPSDIFDSRADFDPSADLVSFLKSVPAKWTVYLMTDAADRPVQLLCVRNLRYSLERRLGTPEVETRSKRVNYRDLVRRVYWRRVDSAFESDFVYWEAARALFPETYRGMMPYRTAWFIHVDPAAEFPKYVRTTDLAHIGGLLIGPVEDKHAAARLIKLAEDLFDLCRYYNILTEAPHGKACAYKEMGRCPAPCDGTISMQRYREMVAESAGAVIDPAEATRRQTEAMQRAAAELKFEQAGKIKARLGQMSELGTGSFRHARRIEDFQFLSLQRGAKAGTAKLFLVTPQSVEEIAGLIAEPKQASDLLRLVLLRASALQAGALDAVAAERVGLTAHHLFLPKQEQGVFIPLRQLEDRVLAQAYRDLRKQKQVEAETAGEGVVREAELPGLPASGGGGATA